MMVVSSPSPVRKPAHSRATSAGLRLRNSKQAKAPGHDGRGGAHSPGSTPPSTGNPEYPHPCASGRMDWGWQSGALLLSPLPCPGVRVICPGLPGGVHLVMENSRPDSRRKRPVLQGLSFPPGHAPADSRHPSPLSWPTPESRLFLKEFSWIAATPKGRPPAVQCMAREEASGKPQPQKGQPQGLDSRVGRAGEYPGPRTVSKGYSWPQPPTC